MAFKMNDSQIEAFTVDCIEKIKESNKNIITEKLKEWEDTPNKSNEDINFEIFELLIETMYSTISQAITATLCEYNRNN